MYNDHIQVTKAEISRDDHEMSQMENDECRNRRKSHAEIQRKLRKCREMNKRLIILFKNTENIPKMVLSFR